MTKEEERAKCKAEFARAWIVLTTANDEVKRAAVRFTAEYKNGDLTGTHLFSVLPGWSRAYTEMKVLEARAGRLDLSLIDLVPSKER